MPSFPFFHLQRNVWLLLFLFVALSSVPAASIDAQGYGNWLLGNLDDLQTDIEAVTKSAEEAAKVFVHSKPSMRVDGKAQASDEILTRRGGLMLLQGYPNYRRERTASDPVNGPQAVVLFILRENQLEDDMALLHKHRQHGNYVVVFGREEMRKELEKQKTPFDSFVNNHSLPGGFLLPGNSDDSLISTDRVSNIAALWIWQCEFVAACTRLGVMPILHMGYGMPAARDREKNLRSQEVLYHKNSEVPPIAPGQAGLFYLQNIREKLVRLLENDLSNIQAVGVEAAKRIQEKHRNYVHTASHTHWSLWLNGKAPYDPGYFEQLYRTWRVSPQTLAGMNGDNLVLCMGWVQTDWYREARANGASLAWVANAKGSLDRVAPGEFWIDLQTGFADAVVPVPGYDVQMAPTDGFFDEAIYWMLMSEVYGLLNNGREPVSASSELLGQGPLHRAILQGDIALAQKLIQQEADLSAKDCNGLTPLHLAAWSGHKEIVLHLLQAGAPVDPIDRYGRTPLHLAASANARECASDLLAAGAIVDVVDSFGETPLHRAARMDAAETLELLLSTDFGGSLSRGCLDQNRTPLHVAAVGNSLAAARVLLQKGVGLEQEDYLGMRPLHLASHQQHAEMVQLLLDAGADRNALDKHGFKGIEWADQKTLLKLTQSTREEL